MGSEGIGKKLAVEKDCDCFVSYNVDPVNATIPPEYLMIVTTLCIRSNYYAPSK